MPSAHHLTWHQKPLKHLLLQEYLRKHYEGGRLQITNMREDRGGWVVELRTKFADGTVDTNQFLLQKDATGSWKIVQDVYP